MAIKKRTITKEDHDAVAKYVTQERDHRAGLPERKEKERIWKEVDRQVSMQPRDDPAFKKGGDDEWRSNIEPGMLADGLEINSADVLRIGMPTDRTWFRPYVEMPYGVDQNDEPEPEDVVTHRKKASILRSFMSQQHADTGLRERIKLSVKEAYKHGSFVAEVRFENFPRFYGGGGVEDLGAPVWIPYSMWDCFPDPSSSVPVAGMSYQGSMVINFVQKWESIQSNPEYVNKEEALKKRKGKIPDAKGIKYFGNISIMRDDGDIFLPNMQVVVIEGVLVLAKPNTLSYSPIIYVCPEKDDVRDSYSSSQLIKRSPTHKAAAQCLNNFIDAIELTSAPPIKYNALDPRFAKEGGPMIRPRAQIPTRGKADIEPIYLARPDAAFNGYQALRQMVEAGTSVDATRAGVSSSTEQTAFEVDKKDQKSEIRLIDFVGVLDRQGLRPYLYMQHELNKQSLTDYPFYNAEPSTPDFMRMTRADLMSEAKNAHFEVTGSKGVLGEERRRQGSMLVTNALLATPDGLKLMGEEGLAEVGRDAYADYGVKDPSRYLPHAPEVKNGKVQKVSVARLQELEEQMNQAVTQLQEQMQKLHNENIHLKEDNERNETDLKARNAENGLLNQSIETLQRKSEIEHQIQTRLMASQDQRFKLDMREADLDLREERIRQSEAGNG